jgi:ABC-type nitrate/sulfonate/bicarbonate transport system permease component
MLIHEDLIFDILASLQRVFVGFFIAILLAMPLGIYLGWIPMAARVFNPLMEGLRPIPPVAWIPLAILWFGIGNGPSYFLTALAAFFPILINTQSGVRNLSKHYFQVAQMLELSKKTTVGKIIAPGALPFILSGCRVGLGIGWMAVVAAEMISARSGLGYLITTNQDLLRTSRVMAGMLCIGVLGFIFDLLMRRLEQYLTPWNSHAAKT